MSPEQIEAVRRELHAELFYAGPHNPTDTHIMSLHRRALEALDHLTKANEELRAEVEEQARLNGMGAEHELSLRATIDWLTKERDWACERLDAMTTEVANRDEHLSALQEAIDEAVRRADTETPFKTHVIVSDVVEPLRPFSTKPEVEVEPEVDPLVALCTELFAALRRYEADSDPEFPAPPEHREMMHRAEVVLAARGGRVVFDGRDG